MSVQIRGAGGSVAEVDTGSLAQRVSVRPQRTLSWNSIGAQSGALTTLAAGAPIFSLRNTGANLIIIRRVGCGFMTTTAFTAAQALDFALTVARNWTTNDTGGADITPLGNDTKHRLSLATPSAMHMRMATTAALTAGTRTLDANSLGRVAAGSTGLATGLSPGSDNLFNHSTGDLPLVLGQNEGIAIWNATLMGAAGVIKAYVNLEYAEVAPADYA